MRLWPGARDRQPGVRCGSSPGAPVPGAGASSLCEMGSFRPRAREAGARVHVCMGVHLRALRVHVSMHICARAYARVCMCVHTRMCMFMNACVCMCVCARVCGFGSESQQPMAAGLWLMLMKRATITQTGSVEPSNQDRTSWPRWIKSKKKRVLEVPLRSTAPASQIRLGRHGA